MPFDSVTFVSAFVTLLVIMDPPGAIPIFLALTSSLPARAKRAAARRASLVALLVIASFAVFGRYILDYLHISVAALQGAGGLLLLIVALQLLMGAESEQQFVCERDKVGRHHVQREQRGGQCKQARIAQLAEKA